MSRISDLLVRQGEVRGGGELARGQGRAQLRQTEYDDQDRMDAAGARDLAASTQKVTEWLTGIAGTTDLDQQRATYAEGRAALIQAGALPPTAAPEMFPGMSWVKSRLTLALPAMERFKVMFPEPTAPKTREIKVRNADGSESIQIVEDTAGQSVSSAAPPKDPPKKYQVTVPGPNGPMARLATEEEMAAGVPEYRAPTQGSTPDQVFVIRNGEITPIQKGTAQPGDVPYDQVAARQVTTVNSEDAAQITKTARDLVTRLETHPGMAKSTGAYEMRGWTQDAVDFNSIRDQLVAALTLPNLGALKGPMSDKDILFVKQLATRLANRRLSEAETRQAISEARSFLDSKLAAAPTAISAPARGGGPAPAAGGGRVNPFKR